MQLLTYYVNSANVKQTRCVNEPRRTRATAESPWNEDHTQTVSAPQIYSVDV